MMQLTKSLRAIGGMTTLVAGLLCACPVWSSAEWNPAAFAEEAVLEFFTVNKAGEEHWATVWFVVIDGDAYIRLGGRAERRITENINKPVVKVRVADQVFDGITAEDAPEKVSEVADRMHDKYWSAMFIRFMPDRYTVRLTRKRAD
jgi:hypothetical protein